MEPMTNGIKSVPPVFATIAVVLCLVLCGKDTGAKQPLNYNITNNRIYNILQWKRKRSLSVYYLDTATKKFKELNCPYQNCHVTSNKNYLPHITDFDAIVFYEEQSLRMKVDQLPRVRSSSQKYVFAALEWAPAVMSCNTALDNFFNWTWTYKLDSDIRWSYILIYNLYGEEVGPKQNMNWPIKMKPIKDEKTIAILDGKTKAAAWFVTHCQTYSQREKFVNMLKPELYKLNLTLDSYGGCGDLKCPKSNMKECYDLVTRDYYFYFCFENYFSTDYVTEKLLIALNNFAIPVVYGGANYSRYLPPGSYLNARELGPVKLAKTMKKIIKNRNKFYDFFRWRNHFTYKQGDNAIEICNICTALNKDTPSNLYIGDRFRKWWQWGQVYYPADFNQKTYYVLQWKRKNKRSYLLGTGSSKFVHSKCPYQNCYVTDDKRYLCHTTDFDVIVFNSYDILKDKKAIVTLKRSPSQRFVFKEESPPYKMACDPVLETFFNWTWTYKLDSDIQLSHLLIYNLDNGDKVGPKIDMEWPIYMKPIKDKKTIAILEGKSKAASWLVTQCKTSGRREDFVHKLIPEMSKRKLTLDVYGNCGNLKCPMNKTEECYDMVKRDYYFYFCFEDSLAADYVTEILLIALDNYAIPVVYGGANYSRFLPPGSYLNARELGPKRLARTMKKIMEDRKKFQDFFRWRNHFIYNGRRDESEICNICTALNENKDDNLALQGRFREWWNGDYNSNCT